jgi:hypothetical protein
VGLPLWIVTRKLAPTSLVSILVAINTVLVVVLQVRMTRKSDDAVGSGKVLLQSAWALLGFALLLSVSVAHLPLRPWSIGALLVVATVLLTFAEMWQSAGQWGLSLALSPAAARSRFLSVFNLGSSALDVSGALLLTTFVLPAGPTGWLVLGGVLTGLGLLAPGVARWAERERKLSDPPEPAPDAAPPAGSGTAGTGSAGTDSAGTDSAGSGAAGTGHSGPNGSGTYVHTQTMAIVRHRAGGRHRTW